MTEQIVKAKKVRAHSDDQTGDFLAGLDNGYVVEAERVDYIVAQDSGYSVRLDGDFMRFTFHTADGDEASLTGPADMPITVKRDGLQRVLPSD